MSKNATINAHDAFSLLESRTLYKDQLFDVLVCELNAEKILCLSDTTDVLLEAHETTTSIAHTIQKAGLGPRFEVLQSDFIDFHSLNEEDDRSESPKFGYHLPQERLETRREYRKVDSTQLNTDLSRLPNIDVVLGKNCICGCEGNGKLCGGIDISVEAQQAYLKTLLDKEPSLIVLSASSAHFYPENDTIEEEEKKEQAQQLYKQAKSNMIEACALLNAQEDSPYKLILIEPDRNLKFIAQSPKNENGYMVVAYDTRKIDFQPTTISLQKERELQKITELRSKVSVKALLEQSKKIKHQETDKENSQQSPKRMRNI